MSKVSKIDPNPKRVSAVGSVKEQSEIFCADWLKSDVYRDWLEPVPENQHKAWCSMCNITLDCSRKELNKHAASTGHWTNLQNTTKRKSVIGQLIGKLNIPSSSGGSSQPRKVILLQRNVKPNSEHEVAREAACEYSEGVISSAPTMKKTMPLNEMQLVQQRYRKPFRMEWLDVPEFKDWLSPDPDSQYKARCLACNTILNAGKSELEKHAAGAKHEKAAIALKQMVLEQQAWDRTNEIDEEGDDDECVSRVNIGMQTIVTSEELNMKRHEEQKQQLEVMNCIASSMESFAMAAAGALESLAKNQETLYNILLHLVNK